MVAITTPFKKSLLAKLQQDLPNLHFEQSDICCWSPKNNTVYYRKLFKIDDVYNLLHEAAHGSLGHKEFNNDLELIRLEIEAWQYAKNHLSKPLGVTIAEAYVDDSLETYRTWVHNRSRCPNCQQNGLQTKNDTYQCLNCRCRWRVNDARQCQLKRYTTTSI